MCLNTHSLFRIRNRLMRMDIQTNWASNQIEHWPIKPYFLRLAALFLHDSRHCSTVHRDWILLKTLMNSNWWIYFTELVVALFSLSHGYPLSITYCPRCQTSQVNCRFYPLLRCCLITANRACYWKFNVDKLLFTVNQRSFSRVLTRVTSRLLTATFFWHV